ncbi:MAG: metal ABC transporter substrate-binding protein [Kiritimatiellia bacterium]
MKNKWILAILTVCSAFGLCVSPALEKAQAAERTVLATTFPIYQIVRNVAQGREGMKIDLMLPSQLGCPHDYALTPQDMQKLAKADILVVNGLGMEEFLGAPVKKANPKIILIDSSTGIEETLQYSGDQHHEHGHDHSKAEDHAQDPFEWAGAFKLEPGVYHWSFAKVDGKYAEPTMKMVALVSDPNNSIEKVETRASELFGTEGHALDNGGRLRLGDLHLLHFDVDQSSTVFEIAIEEPGVYVFFTEHKPSEFEAGEHFFKSSDGRDVEPFDQKPAQDHAHHHSGVNPHLFASPRMTAKLALNIASELSKADPDGAPIYSKNAKAYAEKMNRLADEMAALGRQLKNTRIVQPHGIFDYLARDMGLEIVAVMQPHGQEPSASEMLQLVQVIKEKRAGAIFTEPQYPEKIGKTLSKETGLPVAMLDPVATGPENAPLTYYETIMRQNMKTLESVLGVK